MDTNSLVRALKENKTSPFLLLFVLKKQHNLALNHRVAEIAAVSSLWAVPML